jgi:NAD(P)-dependent dehydrogenase (short-subunit alcohol dehydrogenase family)
MARSVFGRFDGLYHVAGGSGRSVGDGPLHEITDVGWDATVDLNLKSLFLSNRAAVRGFLDQGGGGTILNMSSVLAKYPSPRYFATHAYAAAKSAVFGLTRSAASYYATEGIRFNVICPGLVETPMSRRASGDDEIVRFIRTKQPLEGGRVGLATDLDEAVLFFLSDASRYVTGQILAVDGGWSVNEGQIDG